MNQPSKTVPAHIRAAQTMIQELLQQINADDREAHQGIAAALKNGAYFEVRTCLGYLGIEVLIDVVQADGAKLNIAHVDFDTSILQN